VLFVASLPSLAKLPTFGNVDFRTEGKLAMLGKVIHHGKLVALGNITFLAQSLL
jgi:hypothetical protein